MNQLCRVCGEPAAGFHFGAFTCEGCKSFFGRTYNNLSSISECKNNGECVINKKNRTSCKACRLRKCLLVGMSKSGSRYGRRSNWFKIHCLLQEQQQQLPHQHQVKWDCHDAENNNSSTPHSTPSPAPTARQPSPPPLPPPPPPLQDPARCLALLRSLGPVQDAPMDLSSTRDSDRGDIAEGRKTATPLDLTCVKT
ncbi:hypothetical protein AAG570_013909 [Ranatra chinensis]|uniref:Nuclear receptor domain-containing protein n=1 Tax=Ranatra chinensis TaxID=642074 RepID=A0ABD0YS85_9HEMI